MSGVDRRRSEKEKIFSERLLSGWKCPAGAKGPRRMVTNKGKRNSSNHSVQLGLQNLWTHLCPPLKQMACSSEDHSGCLSWTLRTENRDHNSLRVTTIEQRTTERNVVRCDESRSLLSRLWRSYQWLFPASKQSLNKDQDISDQCFEHGNEITNQNGLGSHKVFGQSNIIGKSATIVCWFHVNRDLRMFPASSWSHEKFWRPQTSPSKDHLITWLQIQSLHSLSKYITPTWLITIKVKCHIWIKKKKQLYQNSPVILTVWDFFVRVQVFVNVHGEIHHVRVAEEVQLSLK